MGAVSGTARATGTGAASSTSGYSCSCTVWRSTASTATAHAADSARGSVDAVDDWSRSTPMGRPADARHEFTDGAAEFDGHEREEVSGQHGRRTKL